jgi:hypothetical protein
MWILTDTKSKLLSFFSGVIATVVLMMGLVACNRTFGPLVGFREVRQSAVSPDGKYVASVVAFTQGALGNHVGWVTVDPVSDKADARFSGRIVFLQANDYGQSITWEGSKRLLITYGLNNQRGYLDQAGQTPDGQVSLEYSVADSQNERGQRNARHQ